jgi:hypothetical protein
MTRFEDKPEDGANERALKHAYRWGVLHGVIDPDSEQGKAVWGCIVGERGAYERYLSVRGSKNAD